MRLLPFILFGLFTALMSVFSASPDAPINLIYGNREFVFYPILNQNHEPVQSLGGDNLYEGISKEGVRIQSTLKKLEKMRRLLTSVQPLTVKTHENSFQLDISHRTFVDFLNLLGSDRKLFEKMMLGMTQTKKQILEGFLFGGGIRLNQADFEALGQNAFSTRGNLPKVKVPATIPVFGSIVESNMDIFVSTLDLDFLDKKIVFIPEDNKIQFVFHINDAELTGVCHWVVQPREALKGLFGKRLIGRVTKANVDPFTISFSMGLRKSADGYWGLKMVDPVKMTMDPLAKEDIGVSNVGKKLPDAEKKKGPGITITFQWNEGKIVKSSTSHSEFNQESVDVIAGALQKTLLTGIETSFFPEDLGSRWGVQPPVHEKQSSYLEYETRLSDFKISESGFSLNLDSWAHIFQKARCAEDLKWRETSAGNFSQQPQREKWALISLPKVKPEPKAKQKPIDFSQWDLFGKNSEIPPQLNLKISQGGLQFLANTAFDAGLYCVSTRSLWPRKAYIPLFQFKPADFPIVSMKYDQVGVSLNGKFQVGRRNRLEDPSSPVKMEDLPAVNLQLGMRFLTDNQKIEWVVPSEGIKFGGFSDDENTYLYRALSTLSKLIVGMDLQGEAFLTNKILEQLKWEGDFPDLRKFDLVDSNLKLNFSLGRLKWLKRVLELDESTLAPTSTQIVKPETLFESDRGPATFIKLNMNVPNMQIAWQKNEKLLYSWTFKHRSEDQWRDWSAFEQTDRATFWLDKPGFYDFQVKAMNQSFDVQQFASHAEIYYQPRKNELDSKEVISYDDSKPKMAESSTKPEVKKISAGGFFGCSLQMNSQTKSSTGSVIFFLLVALGILGLRTRKRTHVSMGRKSRSLPVSN